MEQFLTCNNLKCRRELGDQALVTTCSHIFCTQCVHALGLTTPGSPRRTACLACQCTLSKPHDVVIVNLSPTEDYKTSVLSGLSPHLVMECAGRALSFWAYQTTQEISYQQHLYKTLAEKYSILKVQLDQLVSDANVEIERLQHRLVVSANEHDSMRRKNEELAQAYREKSRKLLQTQELYDKAKRRAEIGHIQQAASDAVDSTLRVDSLPASGDPNKYNPDPVSECHESFAPYGLARDNSGLPAAVTRHNPSNLRSADRWLRQAASSGSAS